MPPCPPSIACTCSPLEASQTTTRQPTQRACRRPRSHGVDRFAPMPALHRLHLLAARASQTPRASPDATRAVARSHGRRPRRPPSPAPVALDASQTTTRPPPPDATRVPSPKATETHRPHGRPPSPAPARRSTHPPRPSRRPRRACRREYATDSTSLPPWPLMASIALSARACCATRATGRAQAAAGAGASRACSGREASGRLAIGSVAHGAPAPRRKARRAAGVGGALRHDDATTTTNDGR